MVIVAQSVRAPDCGSGGRGFESRLSPKVGILTKTFSKKARRSLKFDEVSYLCALVLRIKVVLFNSAVWRNHSAKQKWPHRLVVRSLPFQGSGTSSNLVGVTNHVKYFQKPCCTTRLFYFASNFLFTRGKLNAQSPMLVGHKVNRMSTSAARGLTRCIVAVNGA